MKVATILVALLVGCGDPPERVLIMKHRRPEPITCVNTGRDQQTCTDGAGLIWTCGTNGGNDATCINTGRLQWEDGR